MSAEIINLGASATFTYMLPEIILGLVGFGFLWVGSKKVGEKVISWTTFVVL